MINNMEEFGGRPLDLIYPVLQLHLRQVSSFFFEPRTLKTQGLEGFWSILRCTLLPFQEFT